MRNLKEQLIMSQSSSISHWLKQFIALILLLWLPGISQASWPVQFGNENSTNSVEVIVDSVVDSSGNTIILGRFQGNISFTKADGSKSILNGLAGRDIFIAKYDSSGNYVWSQRILSSGSMDAYKIGIDAADNIYTTGYSYREMTFSSITIQYGLFLAKLDSNGNWLWANRVQPEYIAGSIYSRAISLNVTGNSIYVSY
ncbi:MAG: hypothetical protein OEY29_16040, partial [Gammaproteobacteria bacterium]|nr:hypothetical protein [Gammaproteobacteria bacterium]